MLNKTIMMGRLTAAPELKQTPSGSSVTTFTIAVDDDFKGANGERETDFFDAVAWRGTAEFISRNFRKGQLITITGRLKNQKWTDREGNIRRTAKIIVADAYFCGDYGDRTPAQNHQMQIPSDPYTSQHYTPPSDDDLPF